jgi:peroxiredoxin Q/BCP
VIKEGDKAPPFNLDSDAGGRVSLKDFAKQTLVLYFYPRDNTPGCTRQAQAFTAAKRTIETAGAAVVGVSRDSLKSHQSFREKCGVGITLLSDPDLKVHKAYGAWGKKTMYGKKIDGVIRSTFLIKNGEIGCIFPNVKVDGHIEQVLQAIGELSSGGASSLRIPTMPPPAKAKKATKKKAGAKKKAAAPKKKKQKTTTTTTKKKASAKKK